MAGLSDECVSYARVNSGTDGLLDAKTESTNNTLDAVKVKINSKESSLRVTPTLVHQNGSVGNRIKGFP
jgi:hypothetical protein